MWIVSGGTPTRTGGSVIHSRVVGMGSIVAGEWTTRAHARVVAQVGQAGFVFLEDETCLMMSMHLRCNEHDSAFCF